MRKTIFLPYELFNSICYKTEIYAEPISALSEGCHPRQVGDEARELQTQRPSGLQNDLLKSMEKI